MGSPRIGGQSFLLSHIFVSVEVAKFEIKGHFFRKF